jgi:hypothetical protein
MTPFGMTGEDSRAERAPQRPRLRMRRTRRAHAVADCLAFARRDAHS